MRARVIKKFTSAEGMTILVALLFFMMCAVVGSIILTAATAASGRLSSLRKEEKGYYAAGSVAQFLKDSIEGATFQIRQTDNQDPSYTMNGVPVEKADVSGDALIRLILNKADVNYTLTAAPARSAAFDDVTADIKMQCTDDYEIKAVITTADGYKLSLVIPSDIDTQTITTTETPASTEISPAAGTGTGENGGESVASGSNTTTVVHVTKITTVTWSGGRITATG
ncbi:MAG: hypothetical protein SPL65_06040 [Lachnospiraceae bacterium]|nr:hypothetical protein [Lachnospiraceae bacterium]